MAARASPSFRVLAGDQGGVVFDTSPLGGSDDRVVGEWVMAVGNPYGLYIGDASHR